MDFQINFFRDGEQIAERFFDSVFKGDPPGMTMEPRHDEDSSGLKCPPPLGLPLKPIEAAIITFCGLDLQDKLEALECIQDAFGERMKVFPVHLTGFIRESTKDLYGLPSEYTEDRNLNKPLGAPFREGVTFQTLMDKMEREVKIQAGGDAIFRKIHAEMNILESVGAKIFVILDATTHEHYKWVEENKGLIIRLARRATPPGEDDEEEKAREELMPPSTQFIVYENQKELITEVHGCVRQYLSEKDTELL